MVIGRGAGQVKRGFSSRRCQCLKHGTGSGGISFGAGLFFIDCVRSMSKGSGAAVSYPKHKVNGVLSTAFMDDAAPSFERR